MVKTCPHCGCSDIDEDAARGDATCTGCGTVLEESTIVSENQFQERAGGAGHTLVGQFISLERGQQTGTLSGVPGLGHQESREVTHYKGKKLIEELRINQHCIDTAFNFFKMCVSRNLTRGRVRSHVVAACLYMTCRLENTAHLLLDFSDITQVNVFDLGRTLNFLTRSLRINLPTTDPCLYIMRFAVMLDFGERQKDVVSLATRLVQRMKRDWIATGRRPTGLCGAALLLAARSFNFNRTIGDVVRVVHVSEAVVRKRLDEFSQTPSSCLTLDEFATVDLEHSEDPPAFREARRKAREAQLAREEEAIEKIEKEVRPVEEELEKALEKKRREKFKRTSYAKLLSGSLEDTRGMQSSELSAAEARIRDEIVDTVFDAADSEESTPPDYSQFAGPSLESLGIRPYIRFDNATEALVLQDAENVNEEDGTLDLTGIDDAEIDSYILTETESSVKERFWMRCNGEHLELMEKKKREREEQEEKEREDPTRKRSRKRANRKREPINAHSAAEAMGKVIQEKKLSNKVNYEILKEMEESNGLTSLPLPNREENSEATLGPTSDRLVLGSVPSREFAEGPKALERLPRVSLTKKKATPIVRPNLTLHAVKSALSLEKSKEDRNDVGAVLVNLPSIKIGPTKEAEMESKVVKPEASLSAVGRLTRAKPNLAVARAGPLVDAVVTEQASIVDAAEPVEVKQVGVVRRGRSALTPGLSVKIEPKAEANSPKKLRVKTEMGSPKKTQIKAESGLTKSEEPKIASPPASPDRPKSSTSGGTLARGVLRKAAPFIKKPAKVDSLLSNNPCDEATDSGSSPSKKRARVSIPQDLLRRSARKK